jgi:acetyl-CoA carboxylase carboxyl transferase subunit beta
MLEGEKRQNTELELALDEQKETVQCDICKKKITIKDLEENYFVCTNMTCGNHFRIGARERITRLVDSGTFVETNPDMVSRNILGFEGYDGKLKKATDAGEKEAVITGTAEINKHKTALFVMEPSFMMGSMGSVVGEKITRIFEQAITEQLPVIGFAVSGGARMQEGILSLMQMAKTSGAVKKHSEAGLLFISVLTNPTTGGVTASFASLGDINIAEPSALIGFAGPRVIEQTIRKKLPVGFQRAEFVMEKGFIDTIVAREHQRNVLSAILDMHTTKQQAVIVLEKAKEHLATVNE